MTSSRSRRAVGHGIEPGDAAAAEPYAGPPVPPAARRRPYHVRLLDWLVSLASNWRLGVVSAEAPGITPAIALQVKGVGSTGEI